MPQPPILVVCPPVIQSPKGPIADKFVGAEEKAVGLAREMRNVAATKEVHFFDAATVTSTSPVDGVHLDAEQHFALGRALVDVVDQILEKGISTRDLNCIVSFRCSGVAIETGLSMCSSPL